MTETITVFHICSVVEFINSDHSCDIDSKIFKQGLVHIDEEIAISALQLLVTPIASEEWLLFEMKTTRSILPIRSEYCLLNATHISDFIQLIVQFNEKLISHKFTNFGKFEEYCIWFCNFCVDLLYQQRTSDSKALGLKLLTNLLTTIHKYSQKNSNCICVLRYTITKDTLNVLFKLV